jgi:hypothetical protein
VSGATLAFWAAWRLREPAASLSPLDRLCAPSRSFPSVTRSSRACSGHLVYGNPGPWYFAPAYIPLVILAADAAKGIGTSRTLWCLGASLIGSLCLALAPNAYPIGLVATLVGFTARVGRVHHLDRAMVEGRFPYTLRVRAFGRLCGDAPAPADRRVFARCHRSLGMLQCSGLDGLRVRKNRVRRSMTRLPYPEIVGSIQGPADRHLDAAHRGARPRSEPCRARWSTRVGLFSR